jgi:hypothetical protein
MVKKLLAKYRSKRDFSKTAEPSGDAKVETLTQTFRQDEEIPGACKSGMEITSRCGERIVGKSGPLLCRPDPSGLAVRRLPGKRCRPIETCRLSSRLAVGSRSRSANGRSAYNKLGDYLARTTAVQLGKSVNECSIPATCRCAVPFPESPFHGSSVWLVSGDS